MTDQAILVVDHGNPGGGRTLDFALMVFPHVEAAEHAYTDVIDRAAGEPWLNEVAFVEHHGHGRLIVRGTVAGHYVDVDEMIVALEGMKGGELIRHHLNSEQTQTLIAAVADAPASAIVAPWNAEDHR